MAFTDEEKVQLKDAIHYALPVRWFVGDDSYEVKYTDTQDDPDVVNIETVKNDLTTAVIVFTKEEFLGDVKLAPGEIKQRLYDGLA